MVVSVICRNASAFGQSSGFLNSAMTLKKIAWLAVGQSWVRLLYHDSGVILKSIGGR